MDEKLKLKCQQGLIFVLIAVFFLWVATFLKNTDITLYTYATKHSNTLLPEITIWLRNSSVNTFYLSVILVSIFVFSTVGLWLIVPFFAVSEDKDLIARHIEDISNGNLYKLNSEVKEAVKRLIANKGQA
jgi:lysylphosphatidylglycerol synthetase-like protein (DUF2156 family)